MFVWGCQGFRATRGVNERMVISCIWSVSYTHLRAHETRHDLVCRLLLEKKKELSEELNEKMYQVAPGKRSHFTIYYYYFYYFCATPMNSRHASPPPRTSRLCSCTDSGCGQGARVLAVGVGVSFTYRAKHVVCCGGIKYEIPDTAYNHSLIHTTCCAKTLTSPDKH